MTQAPDPRALDTLFSGRLLLVTGKGGVGKTTITAALGRLAVRAGKKVLLCEIGTEGGARSPLLEALGRKDGVATVEPTQVEPGLDACVLTPEAGHRAFLRDVLQLGFLADRALRAEPLRRFLSAAPAFAELGVLYRGLQLLKEESRKGHPKWDLVILDAPATGHAIAFATLPEVALRIIPGGPIGRALRDGHTWFTDPKKTTVLVTTLPESLPVQEALELVAGLEKSKLHVAGVVANLVPTDPFSAEERVTVDAWIARQPGGVLGARSVARMSRAKAALATLQDRVGRALYTVAEQASGLDVVDGVAGELALA